MATLNQMIAQGAQFNIPDPVAQYNKLAQMQQYQTQNALSQQEAIDKATERQRVVSERTRRATFLTGLSAKLAEKGYTLDRSTLSSMMSSGIPDIEKLAFEGFKALIADEAFKAAETGPDAAMAAAPAPMAAPAPAPAAAPAAAPVFQPSTPRPIPKVGDSYPYTYISGPKEGTTETRIVTQADLDQARDYRGPTVQLPPDLTAVPAPVANAMAPQAPAAAVTNAMASAPAAAPVGELERLTAQRNRYSKISPQTPGDVAKLKNILDGIDKQIEVLNRQDPDAVRLAHSIAATVAKRGTPEYQTAYNKALKEQTDKSKAEIVKVIGVATGTKNPVYLDVNTDEQYTYVTGADGKQTRKLYSGPVDRSTSNVTATANARLPAQEGAFETGLGKGQSGRILANQVVAQDAAAILETNQVGRDLLKSGAITGTGADFFVGFNNALKQVGIDFGYADAAANSQAYAAAMGANVGRIIKQFGAGTGLSDDDRKFAEQMAGGKISLTETALRRILDINDKVANRAIDLHNKNVSGIKTNIPLTVEKPVGIAPQPAAASQIPGVAQAAPASNITQQRQDANAAIAQGAPAAAVRQRFKQNTGQEL